MKIEMIMNELQEEIQTLQVDIERLKRLESPVHDWVLVEPMDIMIANPEPFMFWVVPKENVKKDQIRSIQITQQVYMDTTKPAGLSEEGYNMLLQL